MHERDETSLPLAVQGGFFLASGLWPIVHMRSFEKVTGPKVDHWLVRTVGGLIATIGGALLIGSRDRPTRALRALAVGSALTLATVDVVYAARGRIRRIYFADALVETALAGWTILRSRRRSPAFAT